MMQISYAQNFEDVILWRALKHITAGVYVDIGANDPVVDSVTCWFYEQGWRGLNIEPVQHWFDKLQVSRPGDTNLALAVSVRPGPLVLYDIPETGLATLDPRVAQQHRQTGCEVIERNVPVETLDNLFSRYLPGQEVHYLKIDVEGAEREVLQSTTLQQCRPWVVVVEATAPRSSVGNHQEWEHLLTGRGYIYAYFDGLNRFYVANEHATLLPALQVPPNTFDQFMRYGEWSARSDNHHLRTQLLSMQVDKRDEQIKACTERIGHLQQQLQQWQSRVQAMESSNSWRLTAPLRALKSGGSRQEPLSSDLKLPEQEVAAPAAASAAPAAVLGADLLLHQISSHWRYIDHAESRQPLPENLECALCGQRAPADQFKPYLSQCRFGGGRLLRHQCPACNVIFGPTKMLALNPEELSEEYNWHYRIFTEGDSTEQEIRAFFSLDPRPGGVYLNYGAGAWSQSVQLLRKQGWNVLAYEPTPSVQLQEGLITDPQSLAAMRFDGIYSNNVLEHLRYPAQELRNLANLLKPGARMSHATPCYEYLYEYTRFHLFFYPGRSRQVLAKLAGLDICSNIADGHFINTVFAPTSLA